MTSTCLISVRLGMDPSPAHQIHELIKQRFGVMRTSSGFGVVLHRKSRHIRATKPFHGVVIGAVVTDLSGTKRRIETLSRVSFQSEPMILRCDRHSTGGHINNGNVDSAMAVSHLIGVQSQSTAQNLVSEADTE